MKKILKILKDCKWAILAAIGIVLWWMFWLEVLARANEVIEFYVTHALI